MVVFCDLDSTLFHQKIPRDYNSPLLDGAKEFVDKIYELGGVVAITTARPAEEREKTEIQLKKHGIRYDYLLIGIPDGPRLLVNDCGTRGKCRAYAFPLYCNEGVSHLIKEVEKIAEKHANITVQNSSEIHKSVATSSV